MTDTDFDLDSTRQTRQIGPTRRSVSGIHSFRGKYSVPYESTLERDFLVRLEFDRNAERVIAQPFGIPFIDPLGRPDAYTPDFLVIYRAKSASAGLTSQTLLVEVKYAEEWRANWRNWSGKWKTARRFAQSNGLQFRIHDESRIRDQAFHNIRTLDRYGRMRFDFEASDNVLTYLRRRGPTSMKHVLADCLPTSTSPVGTAYLWHLVATRTIDCDLTAPISNRTNLWAPFNE